MVAGASELAYIGHVVGDVLRIDPGIRLYQGAVGTVTTLRGSRGKRYVLKVYRAGADQVAQTEDAALRRILEHSGLPVPTPIAQGVIGDDARPYLLMTYLPGDRWADRRGLLSGTQTRVLAAHAARLLRRLHAITGRRFGSLLQPEHASAWASVRRRYTTLATEYGGTPDVVSRMDSLIHASRDAINTCHLAALCHNDFIDGNLLITMDGQAAITGVVDLETANWNDPLADLAVTARHLRTHDAAAAEHLIATYGATTPAAEARLAVYDALHILHERNWIAYDKPPGWRESIRTLDRQLLEMR